MDLREPGRLDCARVGFSGEALVTAPGQRFGQGPEAGLRLFDDVVAGLVVAVAVAVYDVELCALGRAGDGDVALLEPGYVGRVVPGAVERGSLHAIRRSGVPVRDMSGVEGSREGR